MRVGFRWHPLAADKGKIHSFVSHWIFKPESMMKATSSEFSIRWGIRSDMPEVLDIDRDAFKDNWNETQFRKRLSDRRTLFMVVCRSGRVVGYIVYELLERRINILRFAVNPSFRRIGIGNCIIQKMIQKMTRKRIEISILLRETNLPAQIFLRNHGFKAISVERNYFKDSDEDAYYMVWRK